MGQRFLNQGLFELPRHLVHDVLLTAVQCCFRLAFQCTDPALSGIDALKSLRSRDALRRVPIVFLTASRDLLVHLELLSLGAQVVHKPFRPVDLVGTIERALGRKEV